MGPPSPPPAPPPELPTSSSTVQLPLWELGVGVGAVSFRDYRGSDTTHAYPVVVPYFIYRGELLKADRNGVKRKLFNQDTVDLNFSLNANTPVRNNSARAGMPDLKTTIEVGPALDIHLWRSPSENYRLDFRTPFRAAFAVGSPGYIGWEFTPNLNLDVLNAGGLAGWNLGLLAGPLFAARKYNAYYYSVDTQYATPDRPAYQASGGYAGTQMIASFTKRYPKFWTGAYIRHDTLSGASFDNSPLVKSHNYWTAGIGIAWIVNQSARMVSISKSDSTYEPCSGCSNP
jgi:MipA family protein